MCPKRSHCGWCGGEGWRAKTRQGIVATLGKGREPQLLHLAWWLRPDVRRRRAHGIQHHDLMVGGTARGSGNGGQRYAPEPYFVLSCTPPRYRKATPIMLSRW